MRLTVTIKWKKRFKPEVVLEKIDETRTITADGRVSFGGMSLQTHLPVLMSMLEFPSAAANLNKTSMIWTGLAQVKGRIDASSFINSMNCVLRNKLSTKNGSYVLSSSLSLGSAALPGSIKVQGATITFDPSGLPRRYNEAREIALRDKLPIPCTPSAYVPVRVRVIDNSPHSAAQHAIDRLDLLRGLLALHVNPTMQINLIGLTVDPINLIRCGGTHAIHDTRGDLASKAVWFEPNFRPAKIYTVKHPAQVFANVRLYIKRIASAPYGKQLSGAIVRAARALDEPDTNSAFLRLWSALESLITPGHANYDQFVRRCAFLFQESDYHLQILEHLREYRNISVHSGVEGDSRINCFLLQTYFREAVRFLISYALEFKSFMDAHEFLDLPSNHAEIKSKIKALRRVLVFVGPQEVA